MNPAADAPTTDALEPDEIPPVQHDERLYRRLLSGGWYNAGKPSPIPQRCFMPRAWKSDDLPGDKNGISIDRAVLTDIETAARRPDTGEKVFLVEFGVSDVQELELTVVPDPRGNHRSHALIPELNSIDRLDPAKEAKMELWALALRNRAVIAYAPEKTRPEADEK